MSWVLGIAIYAAGLASAVFVLGWLGRAHARRGGGENSREPVLENVQAVVTKGS